MAGWLAIEQTKEMRGTLFRNDKVPQMLFLKWMGKSAAKQQYASELLLSVLATRYERHS